MVWLLMKECCSYALLLHQVSAHVAMKFSTIVSCLLVIFTNHRRFKHGVVVNEKGIFQQ